MFSGATNLDFVLFHLPTLIPESRFLVGFGHEKAGMLSLCYFSGVFQFLGLSRGLLFSSHSLGFLCNSMVLLENFV